MVDIILGVLLLYLILIGAYRGFIELFLKSAGIASGVWLAFHFTPDLSKYLSGYFRATDFVLKFFSFSLIITAVFGLFFVFYRYIKKSLLKKKKLSFWDKVAGASGGLVVFIIMVSLLAYYSVENKTLGELTASSRIISLIKR
ncbi:CvpA family protein [Persephonella sp.]